MIGPKDPHPYVPPEKRGYIPHEPTTTNRSTFGINDGWHITNPDIPLSKAFKWAFKMCLVLIPLVIFLGILSANVFWHAPIFWVQKPEFPKLSMDLETNEEAKRLQQAADSIKATQTKLMQGAERLRNTGMGQRPATNAVQPPPVSIR